MRLSRSSSASCPDAVCLDRRDAERNQGGSTMKKILVATDGSRGANAAVEQALSLARELGAEVTFVSVFRSPFPLFGDPHYQRSLEHSLELARASVETAITHAEVATVAADGEVIEGEPADEIVQLADA